VTLPALPSGLQWNTNELHTAGTLSIEPGVVIPTDPTNMTFSVAGGNLMLEWPSNYIGWSLQVQTNASGIQPTPWFVVPDSETTNLWTIPINPAGPHVFYRLFYQP